MVLYRRKPVKLEPLPKNLDDNTEIWIIKETGEIFDDYERFLNRRDFYDQKKFTCESTGHSGYTFFEAKESEVRSTPVYEKGSLIVTTPQTEASREVNTILSDALRSKVLDYVQFQSTARMDDLVNDVFDQFKEHFMVNDRVSVEGDNNSRRYGRITAITDHSQMYGGQSEDTRRSYTYEITMDDDHNERITKYKATELQRDRKYYSKLIFKQFLRNTTSREAWIGAPWMVKEHLAKRYRIPTVLPDLKTRQAMLAKKRAARNHTNGMSPPAPQSHQQHGPNGHPPHVNGYSTQVRPPGPGQGTFVNFSANGTNHRYVQDMGHPPQLTHMHAPPPAFPRYHQEVLYNNGLPAGPPAAFPPRFPHAGPPSNLQLVQHNPMAMLMHPQHPHFQTSFVHNPPPSTGNVSQPQRAPQLAKPFEPVKYPMEDLELKDPRYNLVRPPLKFFSDDVPEGVESPKEEEKTGVLMKSVGPLLCAWETLNVHDTVYMLDSFTFDDFVGAMRYSDEELDCELFVEIHCSILKQIVNSSGKLQANLPKLAETEESEDEESSEESSPTPEPEPPVRTTRSSLRKSEAQQILKQRTPTPEPPKEIHNAAKFVVDFDWVEQCKIRNFRDGGWQAIVVALLHRMSFNPIHKKACEEVLAELVPPDEEPTVQNIAANYVELDVNLRVAGLDVLLGLTIVTEAFRDQLNAASVELTRLRKEKIEHQRKRKELIDELGQLDNERKIHLPDNTPASPVDIKEDEDVDMSLASAVSETKENDNETEEPTASKAKARQANKNKRKAAAEEARKEKAKKAKADAEEKKKHKAWEKLLDSIEKKKEEIRECEANVAELDDDLRETMVNRSKVLGKDRFLNKYYWFEHNGMPFGGVPDSSTAEYGYANGRIWIQGPDEYELQPCLEEPAISQDRERFGFDIPQRKEKEEGLTHLTKSTEWAYYDDPEDIDKLLTWLDERGVRERQLRKELQAFRPHIAQYMEIMKKHISGPEKTEEEAEEEAEPPVRVSTRHKASVEKEAAKDSCLLWTNSIMREEHGHNHLEEYEPPRKGRSKNAKSAKNKR